MCLVRLYKNSLSVVSILIILDLSLKSFYIVLSPLCFSKFQSLLYWIFLLSRPIKIRSYRNKEVSILIILDLSLKSKKIIVDGESNTVSILIILDLSLKFETIQGAKVPG